MLCRRVEWIPKICHSSTIPVGLSLAPEDFAGHATDTPMELNWLTHLEALAICFASCGVVLLLTVYFIVRSSSSVSERPAPEETRLTAQPAMDLESLRMEGYEVLDIYDDAEQWRVYGKLRGITSERVVRTAKIRNPMTGAVSLMKVQALARPW